MQIERASFREGNSTCRASFDGKLGVLLGRDLTNVWREWGKMGKIIARAKFHVAWYRFYAMAACTGTCTTSSSLCPSVLDWDYKTASVMMPNQSIKIVFEAQRTLLKKNIVCVFKKTDFVAR